MMQPKKINLWQKVMLTLFPKNEQSLKNLGLVFYKYSVISVKNQQNFVSFNFFLYNKDSISVN